MTSLRAAVPFSAGETPQSFTSRLAAANRLSAREFCLDFGLHFQSVVDGDAAAIATIADLGGVCGADLAAHAFVRIDNQKRDYLHRGQRLVRSALCRGRVRVCPRCLLDDIAARSSLDPALAVFGRSSWLIEAVKTCFEHALGLVEISADMAPSSLHDFVAHATPALARLDRLAATATGRETSGLERYVLDRLDGRPGAPLLDSIELHAAIRLCEMIGAVAMFGRTANLKRLSEQDWLQAGAAGFAVAAGGEPAIGAFLDELQRTYAYTGAGNEGPQALFGRFYQWLEFGGGAEHPAYDPIRAVVGRHIREHLPVGPGDVVFGEPVRERKVHSVTTLSMETGMHPKRLEKLLRAAGLVGSGSDASTHKLLLCDARLAARVVERARGALSLPAAGRYLNAPRVHIQLLAKRRFITPCLPAADFSANDQYAPADLDEFLSRLLGGARAVGKPKPGQMTIPSAAKRSCCSAAEIIRLILDRKLDWVGRLKGARGYLSVLVDAEEIRHKVRGQDHGGLTPRQVAAALGCNDKIIAPLVAGGHLKAQRVVNPINRCPQVVIMPAEVERFRREYVSLFVLAKERGEHFLAAKKALDAVGIMPAFDAKKVGATFYRRVAINSSRDRVY